MYIRARVKTITTNNILAGWRGAGLVLLSLIFIFEKTPTRTTRTALPLHTPPQQLNLDLLPLDSSLPDGTKLQQENKLLNPTTKAVKRLLCPAKRYTERMTRAFGTTHSRSKSRRSFLIHTRPEQKGSESH